MTGLWQSSMPRWAIACPIRKGRNMTAGRIIAPPSAGSSTAAAAPKRHSTTPAWTTRWPEVSEPAANTMSAKIVGVMAGVSSKLEHAPRVAATAQAIDDRHQVAAQAAAVVHAGIGAHDLRAVGEQAPQDESCALAQAHRAFAREVQRVGDL